MIQKLLILNTLDVFRIEKRTFLLLVYILQDSLKIKSLRDIISSLELKATRKKKVYPTCFLCLDSHSVIFYSFYENKRVCCLNFRKS
jgi:hypothetical protein